MEDEVVIIFPTETPDASLAVNDRIMFSDTSNAGIASDTDVQDFISLVAQQLPLTVNFGGGSGEVATWAEGNSNELIPFNKLNLSSFVAPNTVNLTGNQSISGIKDFSTPPLHNGVGFVELGNDQTIAGIKTFTDTVVFNATQNFPGTVNFNTISTRETQATSTSTTYNAIPTSTTTPQVYSDLDGVVRYSGDGGEEVSGTQTATLHLNGGNQNLILSLPSNSRAGTNIGTVNVDTSDSGIRYNLTFNIFSATYPSGVTAATSVGEIIDFDIITGRMTLANTWDAGTSFVITVTSVTTNLSGAQVTSSSLLNLSFVVVESGITYEEGTWTPGVQSIASGVTLNVTTADYTRIGNTVFIQVRFAVNTNSSSAVADIIGLPYNPGPRGALSYFDDGGILDSSVLIVGGSDDINIYSGNSQVSWADLSGHSNIVISGTYITDE